MSERPDPIGKLRIGSIVSGECPVGHEVILVQVPGNGTDPLGDSCPGARGTRPPTADPKLLVLIQPFRLRSPAITFRHPCAKDRPFPHYGSNVAVAGTVINNANAKV
jgi:hypothetical protein